MIRLILLGPPGAGKGTQAARIARELGIPHISTGVILRQAVAAGTELGARAKAVMDAGQLVSDDIMLGIIEQRLSEADCQAGYILDGFPRTLAQAEALDALLRDQSGPPLAIINVVLNEEELRRRIAGRRAEDGRSDDEAETVLQRFKVYQDKTRPLLDYYGERVVQLDGAGAIDEVFQRLTDCLRVVAQSEESGS